MQGTALYNNEIGEVCETNTSLLVTRFTAFSSTSWLVWSVLRYQYGSYIEVNSVSHSNSQTYIFTVIAFLTL